MKKPKAQILEAGKIPPELLFRFLRDFPVMDKRVFLGPKQGVDSAAIAFGNRYLLVSSDPITFATDEIGWYAVCVNCNDIAVMGGIPLWFFATILLPEGKTSENLVHDIFRDLKKACKKANITLCGGHSEVTPSVNQPIICGTMIGEVSKKGLISSAGARPGDVIILTKGMGIEGTAILARECEKTLRGKIPKTVLTRAKRFLLSPGISVVKDARIALQSAKVSAMHDPTEGGLATGLREMAVASKTGLIIQKEKIPVYRETQTICKALGIDPLGLISSGALLATCAPKEAGKLLANLKKARIKAAIIGKMLPKSRGLLMETHGKTVPLHHFPRDELARLFSLP